VKTLRKVTRTCLLVFAEMLEHEFYGIMKPVIVSMTRPENSWQRRYGCESSGVALAGMFAWVMIHHHRITTSYVAGRADCWCSGVRSSTAGITNSRT
jgi:hypothetical protein